MQYTDYFKEQFNSSRNQKPLPQEYVHLLLSIAIIESNLIRFSEFAEDRYRYTRELKEITGNLTPEQLLQKIKREM